MMKTKNDIAQYLKTHGLTDEDIDRIFESEEFATGKPFRLVRDGKEPIVIKFIDPSRLGHPLFGTLDGEPEFLLNLLKTFGVGGDKIPEPDTELRDRVKKTFDEILNHPVETIYSQISIHDLERIKRAGYVMENIVKRVIDFTMNHSLTKEAEPTADAEPKQHSEIRMTDDEIKFRVNEIYRREINNSRTPIFDIVNNDNHMLKLLKFFEVDVIFDADNNLVECDCGDGEIVKDGNLNRAVGLAIIAGHS